MPVAALPLYSMKAARDVGALSLSPGRVCLCCASFLKQNGEPFWNCVHIAPLRDGTGKTVLFVGVQMDVTAAVQGGVQGQQQQRPEAAGGGEAPGEVSFDQEACPYVHLGHMAAVGKVRMAVRGLGSRALVRKES